MPEDRQPSQDTARAGRVTTYVITNGTKVVGLYLIVSEVRGDQPTRDSVLLVGAALAMGAQAMEDILLRLVDRFLGNGGNGSR